VLPPSYRVRYSAPREDSCCICRWPSASGNGGDCPGQSGGNM